MKQQNSDLGVNREDLSLHHDLEELEFQRVLPHKTLLNSVLGVHLEDLPGQPDRHDREELECPCSAPTPSDNPVQGENLEDFQERQPSVAGTERPTARIPALPPTVPPSAPREPGACENGGVKTRSWALR